MEFHVGDEVIFTWHILHEKYPNAFPPGGTSGIVTRLVGARPSYAEVLFGEFECFVKIESIEKRIIPWEVIELEHEYQVNDEVVMANPVLHDKFPDWYPVAGTVGIVRKVKSKTVLLVQWPSGSTSSEDLWSVQIKDITLNMIPSDANSQELDSFLSEF